MNAKLCKRLRREARAATIGELPEAYKAVEQGRGRVTIILHPRCTKAHYRLLKQQTRKSK